MENGKWNMAGIFQRPEMRNVPAVLCTLPSLEIGPPVARATAPGTVRQEWLDNDGRLIATGGQNGATWWMHWPALATFWFDTDGDVRAEPERPGCDDEIHDVFTRGVRPVVLLARGYEGLHASSVLARAGIVPLVATSGTGKSTIALAVSSTGLPHFADDTVVYRLIDQSPIAVRLPFPVRVDESARRVLGPAEAGPYVGVQQHFSRPRQTTASSSVPASAPFHRIYHLVRDATIEAARPSFSLVSANRRFEVLLAHAHPFEMGTDERRRSFVENLLTVARTVDVWECRFAPDLRALPALASSIREHIDA